ncbi:unnamed protein product [Kuraishia capsulata CBS 1993]|uniref:SH3 domain-containing protein n=1 Tax=Kuraishia capsulata CBS 1993 TaxID=1382522 RepID=W6MRQ3_9ASCO|nr:uncharacterized protein KUCA_T00005439001 [Kuraishia capsulata CBS 1993]CDK29451.1 unnamed protein product [Kuraishia capsulata CBS 1993]
MHNPRIQKAVAIYDYKTSRKSELALIKGEELEILEKPTKNWWIGRCHDKKGKFPSNYVIIKQPGMQIQLRNELDLDDEETKAARRRRNGFRDWYGGSAAFGLSAPELRKYYSGKR